MKVGAERLGQCVLPVRLHVLYFDFRFVSFLELVLVKQVLFICFGGKSAKNAREKMTQKTGSITR